jgi:hypothetical protein
MAGSLFSCFRAASRNFRMARFESSARDDNPAAEIVAGAVETLNFFQKKSDCFCGAWWVIVGGSGEYCLMIPTT